MMNDLLDDLRENRESILHLVLVPELLETATTTEAAGTTPLELLLDAMGVNDSIQYVQVRCSGSFVRCMNEQKPGGRLWSSLFQALLALPNLVSLEWHGCSSAAAYNTEEYALPIAALSSSSSSSSSPRSGLQHFSLSHVLLRGHWKDYETWGGWMKQQTELKECYVTHFGVLTQDNGDSVQDEDGEEDRPGAMELLLDALSSLSVLEDLEISRGFTGHGTFSDKSKTAIVSQLISNSCALKRLYLTDVWLPYGDAVSLFRQLEQNMSLQELAISTALAVDVGQALAQLLSRNRILKGVALRVDVLQDVHCNAQLARAIAKGGLDMFALTGAGRDEYLPVESLQAFVDGVKANDRIEFFQLPVNPTCHGSARLSWELYSYLDRNVARQLLEQYAQQELPAAKCSRAEDHMAPPKVLLHQSPHCVMTAGLTTALCGPSSHDESQVFTSMLASFHDSALEKAQGSAEKRSFQGPTMTTLGIGQVAKKRSFPER